MGRRSLLGGFCTLATAAAAVAGVAYLFKDEIKGTQTYKDLNEKYNVDDKIATYSAKAKDKAYEFKDKAKVAAADIKVKVDEKIQEQKNAKAAFSVIFIARTERFLKTKKTAKSVSITISARAAEFVQKPVNSVQLQCRQKNKGAVENG